MKYLVLGSLFTFLATSGIAASVSDQALSIFHHKRETHYTHDIHVDPRRGVYDLDCSGFAEHVLELANREAAREVKDVSTGVRPLAKDFTHLFDSLPQHEQKAWEAVRYARHLKAGDLIAWLIPPGSSSPDTGHVMIVTGPATKSRRFQNEYLVPVVDAAESGHGHTDPRRKAGPNGVGAGVVGIVVDAQDRPTGFYWGGGESTTFHKTEVRFGRPR